MTSGCGDIALSRWTRRQSAFTCTRPTATTSRESLRSAATRNSPGSAIHHEPDARLAPPRRLLEAPDFIHHGHGDRRVRFLRLFEFLDARGELLIGRQHLAEFYEGAHDQNVHLHCA